MTYLEYIENIIAERGLHGTPQDEYFEMHHIIPRSCGGLGDYKNNTFKKNSKHKNCIWLYPKEHYEAHKLLALENPSNEKIILAWWLMSTICDKEDPLKRYEVTADEYELAKKFFSVSRSEEKKLLFKDKTKHPRYGKHCSLESKRKMSEAKKGKLSPKKGKPISKEQVEFLRTIKLGSKWSEEHHKKMDGRFANGNSPCCVPIYCPELDEHFISLLQACDKYHIQKSGISCCLKNKKQHCGRHPITGEKLTWHYEKEQKLEV